MWFGTQEDLNRYDGRSFVIYNESNVKPTNGKFGNVINDICEDKYNKIWVGTDKGLLKFDPTKEEFYGVKDWNYNEDIMTICLDHEGYLWVGAGKDVIKVDPKANKCIGDKIEMDHKINDICWGHDGDFWVGTKNGLFKINREEEKAAAYKLGGEEDRSVLKIYRDTKDNLWIGTEDGLLLQYKNEEDSFKVSYKDRFGIGLIAIEEYDKDTLWLGFNGDGIVIYSIKEERPLAHIESNTDIPRDLNDNFIQTLLRDNDTMWIGTHSGGVNRYNPKKEKFTTYYNAPGNINELSEGSIFSIFEDKDGFIWIGTYSGELNKLDPDSKEERFKHIKNKNFIRRSILDINEDIDGYLWIATVNGGLFRCIDEEKGKFEQVKSDLLRKNVRVIEKDKDELHFWIGTSEKGVLKFNHRTKEFSKTDRFSTDTTNNELSDNNIYSIFQDELDNKILWVGTAKGLDRVNMITKQVKQIKYKDNKDIRIFSIVPDSTNKDILWVGTHSGLCKANRRTGEIIAIFTMAQGLPNNIVYGILKDVNGNLWFSTNNGISQFNTKEEKVERNFDVNDGLQGTEFNHGACWKSKKTGHMYFGGIKGFSVLHPDKIILDRTTIPPIHFTRLKVSNNELKSGRILNGKNVFLKSIVETKKFELDYRQQPFTLEFAALDFNVPDRIKYKYELEKDGELISGGWIPDNDYTFSNLNPGKYIFKVWSTNSDGYFDLNNQNPAEIEIVIKRHWFYVLKPLIMPILILLGISILLIANFYIVFKSRTKRYIAKLKMIEEAINDVSQREHIGDVIFRMLDYIVYSFKFDYGTISTIDFLNSTIETSWGKTRKPGLIDQNRWKEGLKYKLNESNILTKVAKENRTIEDVDSDLIRLFVPIEFRAKGKDIEIDEANIVFGVVEAGFHRSTLLAIPKEMRITLELFLSYCSSLFYRALKISEKQIVESLLKKSFEIVHHKKYLEMVLANSVILIGGDKGGISFFSFNENKIDVSNTPIFYNVDNEKDKKKFRRRFEVDPRKGIIRHAAETNHCYFSNDVKTDPYYNKEFEDVNSELAVPMRYFGRVIGVLNIYSTEKDFFDDRKANIIQIIADEAAKIFQNKKINQTIKDLVLPFQLFTGIEKIYELIIQNIRDYFMTELVSIWERAEIGDVDEFKLFIACDNLKEKYAECGMHSLKQDIFKTGSRREIQLINFEQNNTYSGFNEFARKYDLKSMILVPIIIDQQVYGFINVFSKRELPSLFPEETTFLNLVATKGAISVQYEKLISSFMEISDSLPSENLDRILGNITDSARRVLHADPVILFRYDQTQENFEATFSGYLFHQDLKKFIKHAKAEDHVVSYVISKGSVWFEHSDDYKEYINKIGIKHMGTYFKDDFWTREKIKSSVGIRLKGGEGEPIGVMFFNYRDVQRFDDNTKRFIEAFSSLASSAIVNAKYQDLIEKQKKELEVQKSQILTKKEKLEFDYERLDSINRIIRKISSDEDLENNLISTLDEIIKLLHADIGYISLLSKHSKYVEPTYYYGIKEENFPILKVGGESIPGWVYNNKKAYLWPSGEKTDELNVPYRNLKRNAETEIIAPLLYSDEVIGFLEVGSYIKYAFNEQDKLFLKTIAEQIAVIIQNKRFHIATGKLSEIHFDEKDVKKNCDILAENADQVLDNSISCVWLLKTIKGRHCLVMESAHGVNIPDKEKYNMFDGEGGISWQTFENKKERIIHEDLINPKHGFKHKEFIEENELESMISVPLIVVNEVIGVLNSYSKRSYKFLDKEVHLLKNLASRGAIAIKSAELTKEMEDINERILDSAQLANPGQVAMSFTHDAKHTMHNINALISALIYSIPEYIRKKENVKSVINSITQDTDYLRKLFNSLVRYAKRADADHKPTKLRDIIEYILYIYQIRLKKNRIACEITYAEEDLKELQIECDRSQIEQVFLNLFNNSIYAIKEKMAKGGCIDIFFRSRNDNYVEIQFRDNGIGILPKDIDYVFEPFFTTKGEKGSGFGLAICKRIVEDNHCGEISVKSSFYEYTTFFIILEKIR